MSDENKTENDLGKLLKKVYSGNSILFVGAGFSVGAKNFDESVPTAEKLASIICEIMKKKYDNNEYRLQYIADFFINNYCKQDTEAMTKFITKMKDMFFIREPDTTHIDIMSAPWKRVYTTNYDNLVELSSAKNKIRIESKTLEDAIDYESKICLHINGKIEDLKEQTLNDSFKLTSSSYLSADSFEKSKWKQLFLDDIQTCSAFVFIGYSLYDMNIEKILYEQNDIRSKVYFIQKEQLSNEIEDYKYNKYGQLLRIGINKFAENIKNTKQQYSNQKSTTCLNCFIRYSMPKLEKITEVNIEQFLFLGKLKEEYCASGYIKNKKPPFLVKRTKVDDISNLFERENIVCIHGDIGNGKTIFLRELIIKFFQEGKNVYHNLNDKGIIERYIIGYKKDIEKIAQQKQESIIVFDSCCKYDKLLEFIIERSCKNIKVVLADRTMQWFSYIRNMQHDISIKTISIDSLDDNEINQMCNIIDNLQLWNDKKLINGYKEQKIQYMQEKCNGEISQILLDIIKSPQIIDKYKAVLDSAIKSDKESLYLFVLCILNIMDIPVNIAILEEIIDEFNFKVLNNDCFKNIFSTGNIFSTFNQDIDLKSPIFSSMVIKNLFDWKDIIKNSLNILEKLNKDKQKCISTLDTIRTNLYRFRFIERILPDDSKKVALRQYYEQIKEKIDYIEHDPQYWLQYAMCYIMMEDYSKAQKLLDGAYAKAKGDYDTYRIDNQQARLYIKVASLHSTDIKKALEIFLKANEILLNRKDDFYTYNIVSDYNNFIKSRNKSFNKDNRISIENICQEWIYMIDKAIEEDRYKKEKTKNRCKDSLIHSIKILKETQ